jgi:YD repeat-containing protein
MKMPLCTVLALLLILLAGGALAQPVSPNVERGFSPEKTYHFDNVDAINVFNGNLNLTLPVGQTFKVGGQLAYGLTLFYAGNSWETGMSAVEVWVDGHTDTNFVAYKFPSRKANAGFGWMLTMGRMLPNELSGCTAQATMSVPGTDPYSGYESPDGAVHCLYPTPHAATSETQVTNYYYSRDGSYLRYNSSTRTLESPDGMRRDFDTQGRLTRIYDRFGNWVTVAYNDVLNPIAAGSSTWHITDSTVDQSQHHRQQYVYFKPTATYAELIGTQGETHESVAAVDLAGFGGTTVRYAFTYELKPDGSWPTLRRPVNGDPSIGDTTQATILSSISAQTLGGTDTPLQYSFTYEETDQTTSGSLRSITLPTGGKITYDYGMFTFPPPEFNSVNTKSQSLAAAVQVPVSVTTRTVYDASGGKLGYRTYAEDNVPGKIEISVARVITEFDPNGAILQKSRHHFSTRTLSHPVPDSPALLGEYGLPVTRQFDTFPGDPTLLLSVEYYGKPTQTPTGPLDVNGASQINDGVPDFSQVVRRTYVAYDADMPLSQVQATSLDVNRRVVAEGTVYVDDVENNSVRRSKSVSSDFDGYGHYRTVTTSGNFASGNARTTTTMYNPDAGTFATGNFAPIPTSADWILENPAWQAVTATEEAPDGTATTGTAMALNCYEAGTGFLTRRRVLRQNVTNTSSPPLDSKDLVSVFGRDTAGNVNQELYAGGDDTTSAVSAASTWCTDSVSAAFRIDHTWTYGSLASSTYYDLGANAPFTFKIVDATNDFNTGLPAVTRSRASASDNGLIFNHAYDFLGRITSSMPDASNGTTGGAGTVYSYRFAPPQVTVQQQMPDGSTAVQLSDASDVETLPTLIYDFDVLGRVTRETKSLPGTNRSTHRDSEYNALGWKKAVSEWEQTASDRTRFFYDAFGRPTQVTAPDGSIVTKRYAGVSKETQTVKVRTGTTSFDLTSTDPATFTPTTSTQTYDAQGRVRIVQEPNGTLTIYGYDVGGRLSSVAQSCSGTTPPLTCGQWRAFRYDNRGFLTSEVQPEKGAFGNGTTSYLYDARGHVIRRYEGTAGGPFDVTLTYDRAERLTKVAETAQNGGFSRILKSFTYGAGNASGDYRNGQLTRAARFNWFDAPRNTNVQVVEDYTYSGVAGRPSAKATSIYECPTSNGVACNTVAYGPVKRTFSQSVSYEPLGGQKELTYPSCSGDCSIAGITLRNSFDRQMLTKVTFPSVTTQTNTITYSDNAMVYQVTHGNDVVDTQEPDPHAMQRLRSISVANATDQSACTPPTITANPASGNATVGSTYRLVAAAAGDQSLPLTYQWYIGTTGDTSAPISGATSAQYVYSATAGGTVSFWMRASNTCDANSHADTATAVVTVCGAPAITQQPGTPTAPSTTRGIPVTLTVATSAAGARYQWYVGSSGSTGVPLVDEVSSSVTVSPSVTTSYWVAVKTDCGLSKSQTVTVTVSAPPTAPTSFSATYDSAQSLIHLQWSGATCPASPCQYQIQRAESGYSTYNDTVPESTTAHDDHSFTIGDAYAYRVITVDRNGAKSAPSVADAVVAMVFTDDPLPTPAFIKGVYFSQARQAIDKLRAAANLPLEWGPTYPALTGLVRADDMDETRLKLNEARSVLGLPPIAYRTPLPVGGQPIRREDLEDLRTGVK